MKKLSDLRRMAILIPKSYRLLLQRRLIKFLYIVNENYLYLFSKLNVDVQRFQPSLFKVKVTFLLFDALTFAQQKNGGRLVMSLNTAMIDGLLEQ